MDKNFCFVLVSIIFTLLSCEKKTFEKSAPETYYVISAKDSVEKAKFPIEHPPFGEMNFVLADSNRVFYYRTIMPWICMPSNDKRPPFLGLQPRDLIELPQESLKDFILLNYSHQENFNLVSVASKVDTIKTKNLKVLMDGFAKAEVKQYFVRRTTHEEDVVLEYKINRKIYLSSKIKWDTTRILIDSK